MGKEELRRDTVRKEENRELRRDGEEKDVWNDKERGNIEGKR